MRAMSEPRSGDYERLHDELVAELRWAGLLALEVQSTKPDEMLTVEIVVAAVLEALGKSETARAIARAAIIDSRFDRPSVGGDVLRALAKEATG